jgi:hypothetical protein
VLLASGIIGLEVGVVEPEQLGLTQTQTDMLGTMPLPFGTSQEAVGTGPKPLTVIQPIVTTQPPMSAVLPTATTTLTMTAPPTTTTEVSHNCDLETPEPGERIQAATDIMFQPAALVPRGTYGTVINLLPNAPSHDLSVVFDDFPHLKNASVKAGQITQAVKPGDRVKAAKDLGGEDDDPAVPKDAVGTVAQVLPPGTDAWEVYYRVDWYLPGSEHQEFDMNVNREQIY